MPEPTYSLPAISDEVDQPTYSLQKIKNEVNEKRQEVFTKSALDGIRNLGLMFDEAVIIINGIDNTFFYKTMKSKEFPDQMQDVYKTEDYYVKFSLGPMGSIVISFKGR